MGRDLQELQRAHLALVDQLYDRLEKEVLQYIDSVYVPMQVQKTLEDPDIGGRLAAVIKLASEKESSPVQRTESLQLLGAFLEEINTDAVDYKDEKLQPIRQQRELIKTSINTTYVNLNTANSALTGYLASVVQIRDVQNELLAKAGVPNLQDQVAKKLSSATESIRLLNARGRAAYANVDEAIAELDKALKPFDAK